MGFLDLFILSSIPVLKVLLVTSLGAFLALDRVDIIGEDARKHLNNVVFFVSNPCLVAINLAKTVTFKSMMSMWFMPVNIFLTYLIGSALGWIVVRITKAPSHLKGLIIGCCSAGNLGTMVIIVVPAICKEKGSPFGDPDVCSKYALAYASLSMAIGAIFLWSYVYNIVRIASEKRRHMNNLADESVKLLPEGFTTDSYSREETIFDRLKHSLIRSSEALSPRKLLAPSTIGAMTGFIVGTIPILRKVLINEGAPLRVIRDSTDLLADGAIPAVTLIMGANLLKGLRGSDIQLSIVIGIIIAKYIILPLVGIGIIKIAIYLRMAHSDPLFQFTLLLQYAVPPAMNIGTITQLFGMGEGECSVVYLWTYGLASVSLTLWSTMFLWIVM